MTANELQKRNEKADSLRVLQTDDGQFFVESSEGKILYNVAIGDSGDSCTCGDFAKNSKRDPDFKCKHILAVFNAIPRSAVQGAVFLGKQMPKLDERWITKIEGKEFVKYPGLAWTWLTSRGFPASRWISFRCQRPKMGISPYAGPRSCRESGRPIRTSAMPIPSIVPARFPSTCCGWPVRVPLPGRSGPIPTWG